MNHAFDPYELDTWRSALGLMPVPLYGHQNEHRFVLLNGGKGNFCLDLGRVSDTGDERSCAWSSDVGHYVRVHNEHVQLWRWDQPTSERIRRDLVLNNIGKFQSYLEERQPSKANSVVAHLISIYRQVRSVFRDKTDGSGALQAFLYLLASTERHFVNNINWEKLPLAKSLVESMTNSQRDTINQEMLRTRSPDQISPIPQLVLRHACGRLFQEAHYLVDSNPQQSLFGISEALPSGRDSAQGAFFTPSPLVRTVVEEALKSKKYLPYDLTILDPACGSGEFLREALRQLQLKSHPGRIKLIGWDISTAALSMAQFALDCERSQSCVDVEFELRELDALTVENWNVGANLILMNPPFISYQGMTDQQRNLVTQLLSSLASKRPDYASAFFMKAISSLMPEGVIGAVIPASLLDGDSYRNLREAAARTISPHLIARMGSHTVFADAIVDTALYVGILGKLDHPPIAIWSNHKAESSARALRKLRSVTPLQLFDYAFDDGDFSLYASEALGTDEKSWAPRPYAAFKLLKELKELPIAETLFDVSQGSITGLNAAFLVSREYLWTLTKSEQRYFRPAVVNNSIVNGRLNDCMYVFYPYGNDLEIQSEEELIRKLKKFCADRLLPNKATLKKRLKSRRDHWWGLTRPRAKLDEKGPKLISTYFGGSGSFAWDSSGSFVPIQGYGWVPRIAEIAGCEIAYLAILNHPFINTLLSGVSNNLSGGQWNLSERFVNNLPLPKLVLNQEVTQALFAFGNAIAGGLDFDPILWERAVYSAYGLALRD